jgi:murein DD-endopeptidase MepM/ murein hydrolase activator NlpD
MRVIQAATLLAAGAGLFLAAPALGRALPQVRVAAAGSAASTSAASGRAASDTLARLALTPPHVIHAHRVGWLWPLAVPTGAARPTVVRGFEPPAQRWQAGHRGVDLLAAVGQDVRAAGPGTVSFAGMLFGRPVVAVDHTSPGRDTLRTTYEPVEPAVKVGDHVKAGQPLGKIASGAVDPQVGHCAPRACLHWGLVRGFGHAERYLDPVGLLDRGPIRLLPVWGPR